MKRSEVKGAVKGAVSRHKMETNVVVNEYYLPLHLLEVLGKAPSKVYLASPLHSSSAWHFNPQHRCGAGKSVQIPAEDA